MLQVKMLLIAKYYKYSCERVKKKPNNFRSGQKVVFYPAKMRNLKHFLVSHQHEIAIFSLFLSANKRIAQLLTSNSSYNLEFKTIA